VHLLVNKKDFAGIKMHGTTIQINHSPLLGPRLRMSIAVRQGAHWQLNCCGDTTVAVTMRALQRNSCLYWQRFLFQYRMDFTETARVCAVLLRIRKDRRK